eukprot:6433939-Pyramimonas_sp.AAC.2
MNFGRKESSGWLKGLGPTPASDIRNTCWVYNNPLESLLFGVRLLLEACDRLVVRLLRVRDVYTSLMKGLWGVERTLAVIGTGEP